MKKTIILCLSLLSLATLANAQDEVNGKVVDKKGNPIFGAKVEVKGTSLRTTTGHDGAFSVSLPFNSKKKIRTQCVGYVAKTQRKQDDMTIVLKKENWWNWKPARGSWFLGVQGLVPEVGIKGFTPGINFGWVKNGGFYFKGFVPTTGEDHGDYWYSYDYCTGKEKFFSAGAIAGPVIRLKGHLYMNVGWGVLFHEAIWEVGDSGYEKWETVASCEDGNLVTEIGLMARWKHLLINAAVDIRPFGWDDTELRTWYNKIGDRPTFFGNFGVSYCF